MAEWSSLAGICTGFWLVHELAWWGVITLLATLLLRLVRESPAVAAVTGSIRSGGALCDRNKPLAQSHGNVHKIKQCAVSSSSSSSSAPTVAVAGPPPPSPSAQCDAAIVGAERAMNLPHRLLGAIAEVESGRPDDFGNVRPWPWTINVEGRGEFFASKQQAVEAVRALQAQGVRSIDVGCMQVNLMHHPNAFASLEAAFDPTVNALYAARFLNTLYGISGSWVQATAAYHSQTPAIGADYQQPRDGTMGPSGAGVRPARDCRRRIATTRPHASMAHSSRPSLCMAISPGRCQFAPAWPAAERRAAPRDRGAGAAGTPRHRVPPPPGSDRRRTPGLARAYLSPSGASAAGREHPGTRQRRRRVHAGADRR